MYPRDDNSTSASAQPKFANFTFDTHDSSFSDWINVVCLRPDQITINQCDVEGLDWVRCPNTDVSGILVRVPAYLANLLLGIIAMYDPEKAGDGVWTQLLTVYSLLISAIIAIYTKGLSRFHSGMTVFLVLSPLSATLAIYAILGFCGRPHRLNSILSSRSEHLLPRVLVIVFCLLALSLLVFTSVSNDKHFTAISPFVLVVLLMMASYATAGDDFKTKALSAAFSVSAPFILLFISMLVAIEILGLLVCTYYLFPPAGFLKKETTSRDLFGQRYPFLHFCGVFFVPMIYWVIVNEIRFINTPDNMFSITFGQVLAVFVILQPLLQVLKMIPRMSGWLRNLTVVRLITGRQQEYLNFRNENQEMISMAV
ncbi:hypothetical protein C8J57DRAFT_1522644 [Mycena rebaudengoi]|nr:hypothetical protein C8J57DRAFT_1522644 [Mycena rebaudengoi]